MASCGFPKPGLRTSDGRFVNKIFFLNNLVENVKSPCFNLTVLLCICVSSSQHRVLIPALWNTDVQEWEINCMNRLVLEEADGGQDEGKHIPTIPPLNIRACKDSLQHSVDYNNECACSPSKAPSKHVQTFQTPLHKTSSFVPVVCLVYI